MKPTTRRPPSPPRKPRPPLATWRSPDRREPRLVFAPLAWLKLMFFLHAGETEVGGFGISAADDPLYVQDFVTVKQRATPVTVAFDDVAVADHFDACLDAGLPPARVGRLWCHTHPGDSPEPSVTDEQTFADAFGACDWSVMFIVSRTGRTYARLSFAAGPGGAVLIPAAVDWSAWPAQATEQGSRLAERAAEWLAEYERNVEAERLSAAPRTAIWTLTDDLQDDSYSLDALLDQITRGSAIESVALDEHDPAKGVAS